MRPRKVSKNQNRNKSATKERVVREQPFEESKINLDVINLRILEIIMLNPNIKSSAIANSINTPLSTVQRRRSRIEGSTVLHKKYEMDFKKLGFRTADIMIKVKNGEIREVANEIMDQYSQNILEMSSRLGQKDCDLVARVAYRDSNEVYEIIKTVNKIEYVNDVQWSEIIDTLLRNDSGFIKNLIKLIDNQKYL